MRLIVLLSLLLVHGVVSAAPVEVGVSSVADTGVNTTTSLTFSHDAGSGSNRVLVCCGARRSLTNFTLFTYAGENLTLGTISEGGNDGTRTIGVEWWYRLLPATGTNDVVITHAGTRYVGGCATFSGVNQGTPFGTVVNVGADANTFALTPASNSGELVMSCFARGSASASGTDTPTPDAPQNEEFVDWTTNGSSSTDCILIGSTKAGANPTVTMDYSWDATIYIGNHVAWSILPAATMTRRSIMISP